MRIRLPPGTQVMAEQIGETTYRFYDAHSGKRPISFRTHSRYSLARMEYIRDGNKIYEERFSLGIFHGWQARGMTEMRNRLVHDNPELVHPQTTLKVMRQQLAEMGVEYLI